MRVAVACDHGGFPLKRAILHVVRESGHEALDLGTDSEAPVDYPDFAEKVGKTLQSGDAQRGILICGSGIGACIAANKMTGIYASVSHDTYSAHQGVEHDDMNVLCLGARIVGEELAKEIVKAFLSATYQGNSPLGARHGKRVAKVRILEGNAGKH